MAEDTAAYNDGGQAARRLMVLGQRQPQISDSDDCVMRYPSNNADKLTGDAIRIYSPRRWRRLFQLLNLLFNLFGAFIVELLLVWFQFLKQAQELTGVHTLFIGDVG